MWAACIRGEREASPLMWRKVSAEAPGLGGDSLNAASAYPRDVPPCSQLWVRSWKRRACPGIFISKCLKKGLSRTIQGSVEVSVLSVVVL